MIEEIELQNVRAFGDKAFKFRLPNLTLLCGSNSSGKSTILKSLLLLRQSQLPVGGGVNSQGRLVLNGSTLNPSQVDLGDFSSFVHQGDLSRRIQINLKIKEEIPAKDLLFLKLLVNELKNTITKEEVSPENISKTMSCLISARFEFSAREIKSLNNDIDPSQYSGDQSAKAISKYVGFLSNSSIALSENSIDLLKWKVESLEDEQQKAIYLLQIPRQYFNAMGGPRFIEIQNSEDPNYSSAPAILDGILPDKIFSKERKNKKKNQKSKIQIDDTPRWRDFPLPPHIDEAHKSIVKALKRIHYIGPLRTPAKRYYATNLDAFSSLDPAGEFMPYLFAQEEDPEVTNVGVDSSTKATERLKKALRSWLHYMRTGKYGEQGYCNDELSVITHKGILVEFHIKSAANEGAFSLADSGFGYSQVLPILTRCLIAPENSTIVIEQPELHLNPALQVRLADFFVAMTRAGKQIVIETHSEHIVNAIRVLTAEDETGYLSETTAIYFIDSKSEGPEVRELSIQKNGLVPDWPINFFGEAANLSSRLLRAQRRPVQNIKQ